MPTIQPIPAFNDNYIWCISNEQQQAFVVDPGDGQATIDYLQARQLELAGILITHHHADHTGGIASLLKQRAVPVYGPNNPAIKGISLPLSNGMAIDVLQQHGQVIATPGHTLDHICYYFAGMKALFCGDTLFCGGCGRLFEGSPATMLDSLQRLAALPEATAVYCAHEYTESNLRFAQAVEPDNQLLQKRIQDVARLRAARQSTVPSTLAIEKQTNPFLRCDQAAVIAAAQSQGLEEGSIEDVFACIRQWKDNV
jgi:hydroxyacylglutathione hydrolase